MSSLCLSTAYPTCHFYYFTGYCDHRYLHSFPTRRSSDLYRKPLEKSIIEIPAGKLENGEEPKTTAIRELEEETGYTTNELSFITSFYTSPGFADELLYIYITDQLKALKHPVEGDEDEFIEIVELTLEEAKQYVEEERIHDAKTNYDILYLHSLKGMQK